MISLLELWKNPNQKWVVADCETENLNLRHQKPWQLSYSVYQGGKLIKEVDKFIWWEDLNVSEDAARITGFNYEKYKSLAQEPRKVLSEWIEDSSGAVICGHNFLNFDVMILGILYEKCGVPNDYSFSRSIVDTRSLAMAAAKELKNLSFESWSDFMAWQYSMLSIRDRKIKTSQASLLKQYGIEHDPSKLHNSLYDIRMTKQILEKLLYQLKV